MLWIVLGGGVLNIGKLAPGGENYYLNSVARGVEDYYLGSGEAPGYWLASGSQHLGLAGEVGDNELRSILRGSHPGSGQRLAKSQSRERIPGFDLTFRAPKSVALLHELGSREVLAEVRAGHDAAVAAALGYLERQASNARRGRGGRTSISSQGFIAAVFRHRTSRAGDPLLHTHVLVANLIRGVDGKWGALDAKLLYRHAKTAGYLYQAHLRTELTRRLGVEWTPVRKGSADIEGISRPVIEAFSQRSKEIEAVLGERSEATRREAEVAALQTRQAKDYRISPQRLLPGWRAKANSLGLTAKVLEGILGRSFHAELSDREIAGIEAMLASPAGLTAQDSSFARRDAIQGFCSELPCGAAVTDIESLTDAFLASDLVLPLWARSDGLTSPDSQRVSEGRSASSAKERRYSTTEMLAVEQHVVELAIDRRFDSAGVVGPAALQTALDRRPSLYPDQQAMVTRLTTSGLGVEIVVGKAGTGKTFALDAAREAWEASGHRVIGCCLAGRAAEELELGAGIPSYTIRMLLQDLADPESGGLARDSVLVVDEAAMVGTRDLALLLDHAQRANAKVVLVGDDRQLPPIEAGGAFRGIMNRLPAIELTEVRRQPDGWERDALDLVREGRAQEAFDAYVAHDRVVIARSAEETRKRLIGDWWATSQDEEPAIILAARRSDVADLNVRARTVMRTAGRLGSSELEFMDVPFAVGDRVMTLKNHRRLGVKNGNRGTIEHIDARRREITFRRDDGKLFTLPPGYLEEGHLTHGYAMTGHKSQAMTTARAYVLADQTLYREWAYVAMSRGRNDNRLYVVAGIDPEREEVGGRIAKVPDPTPELIRALGRSNAKDLALDVFEQEELRGLTLPNLRREWESLGTALSDVPPDPSEELAKVIAERERVERSKEVQRGIREKAMREFGAMGIIARWRNRAQVTELERRIEDAARAEVRLVDTRNTLVDQQAGLELKATQRESWVVEHGPAIRRRFALERELWWREHHEAIAAEVAMPNYLLHAVGPRPGRPSEQAAWREAVRAIECYRARWGVLDEESAFGNAAPRTTAQAQERKAAKDKVTELRDKDRSTDREVEGIERALEL